MLAIGLTQEINSFGRSVMGSEHFEELCSIAYISQASKKMKLGELLQLVDQASMANEKVGITGALFYEDGIFGQVLEGDNETVCKLMSRISQDIRHQNIMSTDVKNISTRQFSKWAMHVGSSDFVLSAYPELAQYKTILEQGKFSSVRSDDILTQELHRYPFDFENQLQIYRYSYRIHEKP